MSRELDFSLPLIAEYLPRFKTGKLSVQDMIDAILVRVAEIDQLMTEQQVLRKKLMDHIGWFKTQAKENLTMSPLEMLKKINAMAEFNRWCGIEVTVAEPGFVEIQMPWRPEVGQYSGFLHAGLIGTSDRHRVWFCSGHRGRAELVGRQLFGQLLAPCRRVKSSSLGHRVVKPGKAQVFTSCDLFAVDAEGEKLVANGQTLLTVVQAA